MVLIEWFFQQVPIHTKSLPPVSLSDTCGRLCFYMGLYMLRQSLYPSPPTLLIPRKVYAVLYVYAVGFMHVVVCYCGCIL